MAGYKVMFTTIPLLINQLKEARGQSVLRSFELRVEKYDLVIADKLCKALHKMSWGISPLTRKAQNYCLPAYHLELEENQQ